MKRPVTLLLVILPVVVHLAHSAEMLFLIGKDASGSKIVPTNTITIPSNEVLLFNGTPEIFGRQVGGQSLAPNFFWVRFSKGFFPNPRHIRRAPFFSRSG